MSAGYAPFVLAAYGTAALVLGGLVAAVALDARRTRRRLAALEATAGRRGDAAR